MFQVWIFDMSDGGGRLLRDRSGHSAPSTKLRHYGTDGQNILTAGGDFSYWNILFFVQINVFNFV